jgi:hypothetical protein
VPVGVDGARANIAALRETGLPGFVCLAHTLHIICSDIMGTFAELSDVIARLSYLGSVSPSTKRLSQLRRAGMPEPPVRARWGAYAQFAVDLLRAWRAVSECVQEFKSQSPMKLELVRLMGANELAFAQAEWLARIVPLLAIRHCESNQPIRAVLTRPHFRGRYSFQHPAII